MKHVLQALLAIIALPGCAEIKLTLPAYPPVNTEEYSAAIGVNDFAYVPPDGVQQNEIRETAMGRIYLTEDVGQYFANAVRRELRQAGAALKGNACLLNGTINDFAIDDLGYSADYITDVSYNLSKHNDRALFERRYWVNFNTTKFVDPQVIFANINKSVSDNIGQLLKDVDFKKKVVENCDVQVSLYSK